MTVLYGVGMSDFILQPPGKSAFPKVGDKVRYNSVPAMVTRILDEDTYVLKMKGDPTDIIVEGSQFDGKGWHGRMPVTHGIKFGRQ